MVSYRGVSQTQLQNSNGVAEDLYHPICHWKPRGLYIRNLEGGTQLISYSLSRALLNLFGPPINAMAGSSSLLDSNVDP